MNRYKAVLIGCGRIGARLERDQGRPRPATYLGALLDNPDVELVAVADADRARAEWAADVARHRGVRLACYVGDAADVLVRHEQPDLVVLATPPDTHRKLVEMCVVSIPTAILVEKPMALSAADAEAMVGVCADAGVQLIVAHSRRFDPCLRQIREDISGVMGEPAGGYAVYTGGLWDSGTHTVDLLQFLLGEVVAVREVHPRRWGSEAPWDLSPAAFLEFPGGVIVTLQGFDIRDYAEFRLMLYGRKGAFVMDDSGFDVRWHRVVSGRWFGGYKQLDGGAVMASGGRSYLGPMLEHVVEVMAGRAACLSSGQDGFATVRVLEAIQRKAEAGTP